MMNDTPHSYHHIELIDFAAALLVQGGLPKDRACTVAETLVESDLMGHTTHGLELLPYYLQSLEKGEMRRSGEPEVISDRGAAVTWNGRQLPGPWLVHRAIDLALERIGTHPVVTVAIQRSHHIGCLAAYPERLTERGLLFMLSSSDPRNKTVAPYGGTRGVYSPDPIAVGIPTGGDPIIFDISLSTTANGVIIQTHKQGERLPHPWLLTPDGRTTDNPEAFFSEPPATILPLGGLDMGYKGFALALWVEALSNALAGYGRKDEPEEWGAGVFLQIIDPAAFGGATAFRAEMDFLVKQIQAANEKGSVRLPGQRALRLRARQKREGVRLAETIMPALAPWAERYGVEMPAIFQS